MAAVVLAMGCGESSTAPATDDEAAIWQAFSVAAMQAERQSRNVSYVTALEDRTFRMGLLHVPRSTEVGLITNRLDAVYFAVSGSASISTDSVDVELGTGGVVYVRGDVEHRIREVEEDLDLVVVFRIATVSSEDPRLLAFTLEEMTEGEKSEESVFASFLATSNVGIGMYMVPKGVDIELMVHPVPEMKIFVDGLSRFELGTGGLTASPGTIAFIPNGVRHQFRKVAEPLEVLAIWAR